MASSEIDFSKFLVAVARPGDTVIIGYPDILTPELIDEMEGFFAESLAGTGVTVHFTDGVTSMVVIKGARDA